MAFIVRDWRSWGLARVWSFRKSWTISQQEAMMPKKMLILKGNKGKYPDEKGNTIDYPDGALHEQAAKDYATCHDLDGDVLPVSGDSLKGNRDKNPQTLQALAKLKDKDSPYAAIYGFSGGGYDVLHILKQLNREELKRIKRVVVLGAPPVDEKGKESADGYPQESDFDSSRFGKPEDGIEWKLVYIKKPPNSFKTPNDADKHMFGPEWLLVTEKCSKTSP
jgi:hypothetical protein